MILKKTLLLILCVIISLCFASCSNNGQTADTTASDTSVSTQNFEKTDTQSSQFDDIDSTEKKIVKFYVNYSGFKMDVNFDEDDINEILDAEKNASVPDVKMKTSFAELIAVYDDNTEGLFGTIYMGEDDCYYLKFANSEIEGAAYKIGDSSLTENLF